MTTVVCLPVSERVLDRLADILFATDEILEIVRIPEMPTDSTVASIEAAVQGVYDEVNELMKKLSD